MSCHNLAGNSLSELTSHSSKAAKPTNTELTTCAGSGLEKNAYNRKVGLMQSFT